MGRKSKAKKHSRAQEKETVAPQGRIANNTLLEEQKRESANPWVGPERVAIIFTIFTAPSVMYAWFSSESNRLLLKHNAVLILVTASLIVLLCQIIWNRTRFSNFIRLRRSRAMLSFVLFFPLIGSVSYDPDPTKRVTVMIADFYASNPKTYLVGERISERLVEEFKDDNQVRIVTVDRTFEPGEYRNTVRRYGKRRGASIVIWGSHGETERAPLTVNFEVLDPLEEPRGQPNDYFGESQIIDIEDLDSFTLQPKIATDISFLTHFTVGLTRLFSSDGRQADDAEELVSKSIISLSSAIVTLEGQETNLDLSFAYYYRGKALEIYAPMVGGNFGLNAAERAFRDYLKAVEHNSNLRSAHERLVLINKIESLANPSHEASAIQLGHHAREVIRIDNLNGVSSYDPEVMSNIDYLALEASSYFHIDYDVYLEKMIEVMRLAPDSSAPYIRMANTEMFFGLHSYNALSQDFLERFGTTNPYFVRKGLADSGSPEDLRAIDDLDSIKIVFMEVIINLNAAISKEPGIPLYHNFRGMAYSMLGLHEEAIADYELALQLDNGRAFDLNGLESDIRISIAKKLEYALEQTQLIDRDYRAYINEIKETYPLVFNQELVRPLSYWLLHLEQVRAR